MIVQLRKASALAILGALAACNSSSGSESSGLRPAENVRAEQAVLRKDGQFGQPVELANATVVASNPGVSGDDGGPWLEVRLKIENDGSSDVDFIDASIFCAGNDEGGGWQAESTLNLNAGVPAGSFDEGTINLLLPGDGRFGEPRLVCEKPASLVVSPVAGFMSTEPAVWLLPDALIDELNNA